MLVFCYLKKKVDVIYKFAYVKPHIITINKIDYLMFDGCDDIYINGYDKDYNDSNIDI